MHRYTLSLLLVCFLTAGPLGAQTEEVRIGAGRFTLDEVIRTVEDQTRFSFAYDGSIIDVGVQVLLQGTVGTLGNLVRVMDSQLPYSFTFYNRYILINPDGGIVARAAEPVKQEPQAVAAEDTDADGATAEDTQVEPEPEARPEPVFAAAVQPDTVKVTVLEPEEEPYAQYVSPLASYRPSQRTRPLLAIKTNLLYGAAALTPNLAAEIEVGRRSTVELAGGYNWYKREGTDTDNKKLVHWLIRPEYRYWLCQPFNGHFVGGHAFYGRYNISAHNLPLMFGKNSKDHRFEGDGYGVGVSYGYNLLLGQRWGAEFTIGAGYARLNYEKFACDKCSRDIGKYHRNYFGPTRAGITLVFLIK